MEANVVPRRDFEGLRVTDGLGRVARPNPHPVNPFVRIYRSAVDRGLGPRPVLAWAVQCQPVGAVRDAPGNLLKQTVAPKADAELTPRINAVNPSGNAPVALDEAPGKPRRQKQAAPKGEHQAPDLAVRRELKA